MASTLRELAGELYSVESNYAQTMRWQRGTEAMVKEAERRMNVLCKIQDHRESGLELSGRAAEKKLKRKVDDLVFSGSTDPAAITALIKCFAPVVERSHANAKTE